MLLEHVRARNVDIVVVTSSRSLFEQFQVLRVNDSFVSLPTQLRASAEELALYARNNRLMLAVGLAPTLAELLERVSEPVLDELSVMEQSKWACAKLGGAAQASLKCGVRLVHSLLASMVAVTLFVSASGDERLNDASAASAVEKVSCFACCLLYFFILLLCVREPFCDGVPIWRVLETRQRSRFTTLLIMFSLLVAIRLSL